MKADVVAHLRPDLWQARQDYLSSGDEACLPIVDAHHHFWDVENNPHPWLIGRPRIPFRYGDYEVICRNFLLSDYIRVCGGHRVLRHVAMEGEWTPLDPAGEACWMHSLARRSGAPQAMAAQIWLDRSDVEDVLRAYAREPLRGFVRSVRHKPRCAADERQWKADWCVAGSMRDPRWRDGYARLAGYGLMFELQAPWWHMEEAAELARDFPGTRLIVNHAGLPGGRDEPSLAKWRRAMAKLAPQANVVVKISGLGECGTPWTALRQAPVVEALLADFGVGRCLFASNYPVDALVVGLDALWSGFKFLTRRLHPEQRLALFCDNAIEIYGLQ